MPFRKRLSSRRKGHLQSLRQPRWNSPGQKQFINKVNERGSTGEERGEIEVRVEDRAEMEWNENGNEIVRERQCWMKC